MNRFVLFAGLMVLGCGTFGVESPAEETSEGPLACADHLEGCGCPSEGAQVTCYEEPLFEGSEMVCGVGTQTCHNDAWSTCEQIEERRTNLAGALINPVHSCNMCHPSCFEGETTFDHETPLTPDNSENVSVDSSGGLVTDSATVTDDHTIGVGGDETFDPTTSPSEGVELDAEGALVLGQAANINDSIWIANTGEGTISRFDITTFAEIGRFWVGPYGRGNDPSRTSINTAGDAFVAGRRGVFVTKISGRQEACPDTNGDGRITTSTNGVALPWGQDDCVIWTRNLRGIMPNGYIRAVAAQDIVDPVTGDVEEWVWVGGYSDRRIAVLDGATGAIRMVTYASIAPYGMAFDGSGGLWISSLGDRRIARIDTNRCNADGCPWNGVCQERWSSERRCLGAIKRTIPIPNGYPYGITVDASQRVWVGGRADVYRYEPALGRWIGAGIGWDGGWKAGIAVDGSGNAWTTGSFGIWRIDTENPRNRHLIPRNGASQWARGWGVAVAADDRTWIIGRWENAAWVVEPGAALNDNTFTRTATTVRNPYTYSDMTGQQLRLAATPRGTYVMTFEGCGTDTRWEDMTFDVETPPNTSVSFRVRTGNSMIEVNGATWHGVGRVPPLGSPLDVGTVLDAAGITHGAFAQVEVALESSILDPTMFVTPRVRTVQLNHTCNTPMPGFYQRTFDASSVCNIPPECAYWEDIEYRSETPGDSTIVVEVRAAESLAELATATDVSVTIPSAGLPDIGRIDIQALLASAGLPSSSVFLRVRMNLIPSSGNESAILYQTMTRWDCRPCL